MFLLQVDSDLAALATSALGKEAGAIKDGAMIKCEILVEEIPGRGLQFAIVPQPENPTEKELQGWEEFQSALFIAADILFHKAKPGAQRVEGEDIRGLVEERIANLRKLKIRQE